MIIGHGRQVEYLDKVLKRGRLAHAYLFYGPRSVGKLTLAKEIAKTFYCLDSWGKTLISRRDLGVDENDCTNCRYIETNSHPYVIILDPDRPLVSKKIPKSFLATGMVAEGLAKKRKEISIEDIRELKRSFSLKPEGNKWRVVIINEAERMSSEAANAFLKLLEEPPDQSLFILVTHSIDSLFPTIVSRTQPIRFPVVNQGFLRDFIRLRGAKEDIVEEILKFSAGRPGIALSLLSEEKKLDFEIGFSKALEAALKRGAPEIFYLSEKSALDEELRSKLLEYTLGLVREDLKKVASGKSSFTLVNRIKNIMKIGDFIESTNINPRLALDVLLMQAAQGF